ncbi:hypothetical protein HII31_02874 [Pseudocercospora fuligena]|uniref:Uncharacterized protein n=1 Tax=Pseudocercospora fuligena TaxID=685502 RepID=A0A8H6RRC6_9PEZI|nr:hypothetical protein HII31_02874 [Pseudocercospora fuligena]
MSWMRQQQNGSSNYLNGSNSNLHRFDFDDSSPGTSDAERSRSRGPQGYGGYGAPTGFRTGVARLDKGHAQRRSRDFDASQSRSRSRAGARYGTQGGQIEGQ